MKNRTANRHRLRIRSLQAKSHSRREMVIFDVLPEYSYSPGCLGLCLFMRPRQDTQQRSTLASLLRWLIPTPSMAHSLREPQRRYPLVNGLFQVFFFFHRRDWHWILDREGVAWPGGLFPLYCLAEGQGCAAGLAAGMSRNMNMNGGPLHGGLQSAYTCMLRRAAGREMKL